MTYILLGAQTWDTCPPGAVLILKPVYMRSFLLWNSHTCYSYVWSECSTVSSKHTCCSHTARPLRVSSVQIGHRAQHMAHDNNTQHADLSLTKIVTISPSLTFTLGPPGKELLKVKSITQPQTGCCRQHTWLLTSFVVSIQETMVGTKAVTSRD